MSFRDVSSDRGHVLGLASAVVLLILGAVLTLHLGFVSDDPAATAVPDWQFYSAWTLAAAGVVGAIWALVALGRRGRTWAWAVLAALVVPFALIGITFLAVS